MVVKLAEKPITDQGLGVRTKGHTIIRTKEHGVRIKEQLTIFKKRLLRHYDVYLQPNQR